MSEWRTEATRRLPELQPKIVSPEIRTPADLWMMLGAEFDLLMRTEPIPVDLLSRIWEYAKWSSQRPGEPVWTAAWSYFFENLKDTRRHRAVCPSLMSSEDYEQYFQAE